MWKFLKNLFKKRVMKYIEFKYDRETTVTAVRQDGGDDLDGWEVNIDTYKDLSNEDMIKIIREIRKRIK